MVLLGESLIGGNEIMTGTILQRRAEQNLSQANYFNHVLPFKMLNKKKATYILVRNIFKEAL